MKVKLSQLEVEICVIIMVAKVVIENCTVRHLALHSERRLFWRSC